MKDQGESSVCAGGHAEAVTETKQRSVLFPEEDTKNIAELTSDILRLLYSIGVPKRIETVYILLVHTYITTSIYSWILKTEALTWG